MNAAFQDKLPAFGYDQREAQFAMAHQTTTTLLKNRVLLAEAGVGTGKTYAYLVPAMLRAIDLNKPIIITTGTLVLQDQLVRNITEMISCLDLNIRHFVQKGKEHYVCIDRLYGDLGGRAHDVPEDLIFWAEATKAGDRKEAPEVSDDIWDLVKVDESCVCSTCKFRSDCAFARTRSDVRNTRGAAIIVVNHNLFMADLCRRLEDQPPLLPDYAAVIIDEAHRLESAAQQAFGHRLDHQALASVRRQIRRLSRVMPQETATALEDLDQAGLDMLRALRQSIDKAEDSDAMRFTIRMTPSFVSATVELDRCLRHLQDLLSFAEAVANVSKEAQLVKRASDKVDEVRAAVLEVMDPDRHILWGEQPAKGPGSLKKISINTVPRNLNERIARALFETGKPVVLTSATLTGGHQNFAYISEQLGVPVNSRVLSYPSPFDYRRRMKLYTPTEMPRYSHQSEDSYYDRVASEVADLIKMSEGRALVLFTSYRGLELVHRKVSRHCPYPVLKQGDASRAATLSHFRNIPESVLFATGSFWEGIDVPGDSLSMVIITKLPFPPSDPLLRDREGRAMAQGKNPFNEVILPEMLIQLKQGAGRLIRKKTDSGVVAILDNRFIGSHYEKAVWDALPPGQRITESADVASFFQALRTKNMKERRRSKPA